MKNNSETKTISELLNTFTFGDKFSKGKSLSDTIKQSTVFSFWDDVVGAKFANFTKPIKIKSSKLYVSAKSPVIIQEINMAKSAIIKKINTYANALGIEIKDLVLDYKNYVEDKAEEEFIEDLPIFYDKSNLDDIKIDEKYIEQIENNISKINFLSDKQKQELQNKIINLKKAEIKRQS